MNPIFPYIFPIPSCHIFPIPSCHASISFCFLKQSPSLPLSSVVRCTVENPITCPNPAWWHIITYWPDSHHVGPNFQRHMHFPTALAHQVLGNPTSSIKSTSLFHWIALTTIMWDGLASPSAVTLPIHSPIMTFRHGSWVFHTLLWYLLHLLIRIYNPMHMQSWKRRPITYTFLQHCEQWSPNCCVCLQADSTFPRLLFALYVWTNFNQ